jgi:polyisoprenoid-binding protein YceI
MRLARPTIRIAAALALAAGAAAAAAQAEPRTFDFEDPKGVNAVAFFLDAPLEPIVGVANRVRGRLVFDPLDPGATSGWISLDAASLEASNPAMTTILQSDRYMDVEDFPEIRLEVDEVVGVTETDENVWTGGVVGRLTVRGKTMHYLDPRHRLGAVQGRQTTDLIPATVTFLPGKLPDRMQPPAWATGNDLMMIRSTFTILREWFEIPPGTPSEKVANEITLRVAIVGTMMRPAEADSPRR